MHRKQWAGGRGSDYELSLICRHHARMFYFVLLAAYLALGLRTFLPKRADESLRAWGGGWSGVYTPDIHIAVHRQ